MNYSAIQKRYIAILSFIFIAFIFLNGRAIAKDTVIQTNSEHTLQQTTIGKPILFTNKKDNIQLAKAATKKNLPKQKTKYKKKKKKLIFAGEYIHRVRRHLAKHRLHPGKSLKGRVVLSFIIYRNGEVSNIKLTRKSHNKQLNRAALAMVVLASPFPRMPYGGPSYMRFSVPIAFRGVRPTKKLRRKSKKRKNKK